MPDIVAKISIMINSTIIANGFNAEKKHLFAISEMTQKHILVDIFISKLETE